MIFSEDDQTHLCDILVATTHVADYSGNINAVFHCKSAMIFSEDDQTHLCNIVLEHREEAQDLRRRKSGAVRGLEALAFEV